MANKENISVDAEKCTGCLICQLICSFTYTGTFNPAKARIVIEQDRGRIHFAGECVDTCHLCANYCVYGAITRKGKASEVKSGSTAGC